MVCENLWIEIVKTCRRNFCAPRFMEVQRVGINESVHCLYVTFTRLPPRYAADSLSESNRSLEDQNEVLISDKVNFL